MRVSVVTCTRNRPEQIGRLVPRLLESTHPDFEHIIVDQSTDWRTREAVAAWADQDRRIRYCHCPAPEKSRALNFGIRQSSGPVLALTEENCEPRADWLAEIVRLFHETEADIICGKVSGSPPDPGRGYPLGYDPGQAREITDGKCRVRELGIGANLGIRRGVFARVGYFDELVGPGGIIPAGDDRDFLYRAAKSGCRILLTPGPEVVHYPYPPEELAGGEGDRWRDMGLVLPYVKYMRRRDAAAFYHCFSDILGDARASAGRVARRQHPAAGGRLRFLISGLLHGMRYPLDPKTMLFNLPNREEEK